MSANPRPWETLGNEDKDLLIADLLLACEFALGTIATLAQQQAKPDLSWQEPYANIRKAIRKAKGIV